MEYLMLLVFFFQAEDGIRDAQESRGLGDVYKRQVVDGPFAETKELVAGFWLIQAKSREEAIEWARRAPFREGVVEVRPLFELEDFPVDQSEKPDGWRQQEEQFRAAPPARKPGTIRFMGLLKADRDLSLIHISEPTRLLSISYAVFCL